MKRIAEMDRLFFEATPQERAEHLRHIRARTVETQHGCMTREDFERALSDTENLNAAAVKLGVCRRTLQYHMRLLGLPPGGKRVLASST
jgi:transcriptional regulator with PAS, ATPase and Fis domain